MRFLMLSCSSHYAKAHTPHTRTNTHSVSLSHTHAHTLLLTHWTIAVRTNSIALDHLDLDCRRLGRHKPSPPSTAPKLCGVPLETFPEERSSLVRQVGETLQKDELRGADRGAAAARIQRCAARCLRIATCFRVLFAYISCKNFQHVVHQKMSPKSARAREKLLRTSGSGMRVDMQQENEHC